MNEQLMSNFVNMDDNNNADTQQPTLKERQTNDKRKAKSGIMRQAGDNE